MSHKKFIDIVTFPLGADEHLWFSGPHKKFLNEHRNIHVTVENALRKFDGNSFVENLGRDPEKPMKFVLSADSQDYVRTAVRNFNKLVAEVYRDVQVQMFPLPPFADARDFCNNVGGVKDVFEKQYQCKVICSFSKGLWNVRIAAKSLLLAEKAKVAFCALPLLSKNRYYASWSVTHIQNCSALDEFKQVVDKFNKICSGQHVAKYEIKEAAGSSSCDVTVSCDSLDLFDLLCFHLDCLDMCSRDHSEDRTETWLTGIPLPNKDALQVQTLVRQHIPGTGIALDYHSPSTTV